MGQPPRVRLILSGILMISLLFTPFVSLVEAKAEKTGQDHASFSKGTLEEAVVNAMSEATTEPIKAASLQERAQVNVKRQDQSGKWVFGTAVIEAPKQEGMYPEGWIFTAKKTKNGWKVGLEGSQTFAELVEEAPLIEGGEKEALLETSKFRTMSTERTGLRLPWTNGQTWTMSGGPHGWAGYDRPYSSLDFAGGDQRVLAARGGYVYTMCSNNRGWIRIVHDNGLATDYYHLWDNIVPVNGSWISEGAFLGYTGTDVSCGGAASGRHVHFALRVNGAYVSLHRKEIGGWLFFGGAAYNGYAMHGSTVRYPGGGLYNYGRLAANQGIVDANGGGTVNLRSGPGTNYGIVGSVNDGAIVTVSCTAYGTSHSGRYGSTSLWNRLSNGTWMSDAYLYTGTNGPVAPPCW